MIIVCVIYNSHGEREKTECVSGKKNARKWFENAFISLRDVVKTSGTWAYHAK